MAEDDDLLRDYTRVRLDGDAQIVEVAVITWQGAHSPELSWVETDRLAADASVEDVRRARRKLLQRQKFLVVCSECGERNAKGHANDGVCHGCMAKNGTVF